MRLRPLELVVVVDNIIFVIGKVAINIFVIVVVIVVIDIVVVYVVLLYN